MCVAPLLVLAVSDATDSIVAKNREIIVANEEELAADEQVRRVYLGQNFELRRKKFDVNQKL